MIVTSSDQDILESLVRNAGKKLLDYWPGNKNKRESDLAIQKKSDGSSVTAADFASNSILMDGLSKNWPEFGIISEEVPQTAELRLREKVWIIDPLDGTKSFIDGRDDFSILIGLCERTRMEFGMMYFPALKILAKAGRSEGSTVNGQPINVSNSASLRARSLYYRNFTPKPADYLFPEWMDSGLAFLALSRGDFDGVILRMTTHKEWDIAAPAVIIEASGGRLTDEKGNPIRFNQGEINFDYVVASNGKVHDQLLNLIQDASE